MAAVLSLCGCGDKLGAGSVNSFVGVYSYRDRCLVTLGSSTEMKSLNGEFKLTKLSDNMVKLSGAWNTIGEVIGNTVSFRDDIQANNDGHMVYSFGVGTLEGDVLTFDYLGSGSAKNSAGSLIQMTSRGHVVATKKQ